MPGRNTICASGLLPMAAEFRCEVFRPLHAVDFVAGRASQLNDEFASVGDVLWVGGLQVDAGAVVGVRFGLQERSQDRDLLRREAVMRHGRCGVVDARVCEPCIEPLGFSLVADARKFGADVAADEIARGVLHGVAGSAERLAIEAWSGGGIGLCDRLNCRRRCIAGLRCAGADQVGRDIARVRIAELVIGHGRRCGVGLRILEPGIDPFA